MRPIAFFTWNAHTFVERWARRGGLFLEALVRPALYASHRVLATRALHALLRGVTRDRLDLLGEEYFHYVLKPHLKPNGLKQLNEWMAEHGPVVLVSQGIDHVMRPLAQHLGVEQLVANRLEFRKGVATGRLLDPVIRPRGPFAMLTGGDADGHLSGEQLLQDLGLEKQPESLRHAIFSAARPAPPNHQSSGDVRQSQAGSALVGAANPARQADSFDWRHRFYRQGLARAPAFERAGDRQDLFVDSPPAHHDGPTAL